jgi:hypothetical protein
VRNVFVGFGSGVASPLMADIARVTESDARTGVMSIMMSVRQFALLFGKEKSCFGVAEEYLQ